MHTIAIGVNYLIGNISQDKQAINTSKCVIKIEIESRIYWKFIKFEKKINQSNDYNSACKYTNNGLFSSC